MATATKARMKTRPAQVAAPPPPPLLSGSALADEMEADADAAPQPPADKLTVIVAQAANLREQQKKVIEHVALADDAKKEAFRISTVVLPPLMDEVSIKELSLEGEDRLCRETDVYTSIATANMTKAIAWLDKHNYGAIVKSVIIIPLDRANPKRMAAIRKLLISRKIEYEESGKIHAQTLTAFGKESVEEGRKLCKEISTHVQPVVKIRAQKKPTKRKSVV